MPEYKVQIKQNIEHPRCRISRQFIWGLEEDRNIRTGGSSGLYYFTVLCSHASPRVSYLEKSGIGHTIFPGEWVCTLRELSGWFHARSQRRVVAILEKLQGQHLISYLDLGHKSAIKYKVRGWKMYSTVPGINCPHKDETSFFYLPTATAAELVKAGRCSEMDILLDLWLSAVYNDAQVHGSELEPVSCLRNGTGDPLTSCHELSARWKLPEPAVRHILKKLNNLGYISLHTFAERDGVIIFLGNYLSTMFQMSDVLIDKEETAMNLNVHIALPDKDLPVANEPIPGAPVIRHVICLPGELPGIPVSHMEAIIQKAADVLAAQGVPCFQCQKSRYKLSPFPENLQGGHSPGIKGTRQCHFGMSVLCGKKQAYLFELTLSPLKARRI